jgi:antitoxin (DNA-binding transcriptional repressor) of toxin-antitoxin stability system
MTYTLSVAEAASQLSELVHRLHANDTVVLVENDVPVAELIPSAPQNGHHARTELAQSFLRIREELLSKPDFVDITDEEIQAEIDAYRRGE